MTKEQVIDKITKLLALANDKPDENECKVALLMAQKFMMKYHISEDMLVTEKDRITSYMAFHPEMKGYRVDLAVILAPNYRCTTFIRNGYIFFMGEDSDAKICKAAFEFAYKNIKRDALPQTRLPPWSNLDTEYTLAWDAARSSTSTKRWRAELMSSKMLRLSVR